MKILIIADEVWNDRIHGNNVLSNWFDGFDAEFAEIYCNPGTPQNHCCERYFQVTDAMMARSFFGKRAGRRFVLRKEEMYSGENVSKAEQKPERFYRFMKAIASEGIRIIRDGIWVWGRYDTRQMRQFVQDFNPDVVYCPRLLTPKLRRLEAMVAKMTDAPFVAFTADDEASLREISYSPLFWIRRWCFRRVFRKHVPLYRHYFMFSEDQAKEYAEEYGLKTSVLFKSGDFEGQQVVKSPNTPLKLVYAGRLYCNRWKTLEQIGLALQQINAEQVKAELFVYTKDDLTDSQKEALSEKRHIHVMGAVSPDQLSEIYRNADVALHVESFDRRNRLVTRVSFSTKIIDLMASSCAILAICWDQHAGYQYLKKHDAAFCASSFEEILPLLTRLANSPELIQEYADKAWICGQQNHSKEKIQRQLRSVFGQVITENTK